MKKCSCQNDFEITEEDRKFYQKINVPEPTLCPDCRQQRRMAFRNERSLYRRSCDLCDRSIIATFDADSPLTVYCPECWWSDKWEPKDYAQEFDFSRSFFEQFQELLGKVPKSGVLQVNNENCEYNSLLAFSKNTYMSPGSYLMENCYYSRKSQKCKDCVNSNVLNKCELVANSTNCDGCYSSSNLINCRNCSFSTYLRDCSSLQNCFLCSGLKNQQYCFKNKQYSKEDYEKILAEYKNKDQNEIDREFQEFNKSIPKKAQIQLNCENSTGDYLYNCKNAIECSDCFDTEDSKYLVECAGVKDSMDLTIHDKEIELCYEMSTGGEKNYNSKFSYCVVASPNSDYLYSCFYLSDSFGCDGFHARAKNCILNKQYSKEEYEQLKEKS